MSVSKLFSEQLCSPIENITTIKENAYCRIYRATTAGKPIIIKHYRENAVNLMMEEAKAIQIYHNIVQNAPQWLDCNVQALIPEHRLLCMDFVPGESLTDFIYRSRKQPELQTQVLHLVFQLGILVGEFYEKTSTEQENSAFLYEYITYCSRRLRKVGVLGKLFWSKEVATAEKLIEDMKTSRVATCFAHGDLVPRNIHVSGDRIGLIDFTNSNSRSHFLNDRYNFRLAISNMWIPNSYKEEILHTFDQGIQHIPTQAITHKFYYEYHRRRWLMLKVYSKNPWEWLQCLSGFIGFARRCALYAKEI